MCFVDFKREPITSSSGQAAIHLKRNLGTIFSIIIPNLTSTSGLRLRFTSTTDLLLVPERSTTKLQRSCSSFCKRIKEVVKKGGFNHQTVSFSSPFNKSLSIEFDIYNFGKPGQITSTVLVAMLHLLLICYNGIGRKRVWFPQVDVCNFHFYYCLIPFF